MIVDVYRPKWNFRSAADWLAEAEHLDRMADRFRQNGRLSDGFRNLAAHARKRAAEADS